MTRESSSKAEFRVTVTGVAGRSTEVGSEPPPSSSRTKVTRITRSDAVEVDEVPCSSNMTMEAWAAMNAELGHSPEECIRTRMIGELSRMMRDPEMPEDTRTAGLTLIGWLARRMPGEAPHALGAPREGATRANRSTSDVGPRGKAVAVTSVAERRTGKR